MVAANLKNWKFVFFVLSAWCLVLDYLAAIFLSDAADFIIIG